MPSSGALYALSMEGSLLSARVPSEVVALALTWRQGRSFY